MEKAKNPANRLAWIGLLLSAVGGIAFFLLIGVRSIRVPEWAFSVVVVIGLALTVVALVKKRTKTTLITGVFSLLLGLGFLSSVYVLMRLPADAQTVAVGKDAPDFEVPNPEGRPIRLSSMKGKPVLLVFYRGHW